MNSEHPIDLLPSLALGCLAPEERDKVDAHLPACAECRAELDEYRHVTDQLGLATPLKTPPGKIKAELMRRIRKTADGIEGPVFPARLFRWAAFWPGWIPAGVLTALMIVLALGVSHLYLWKQMGAWRQDALENVQIVYLRATAAAPGAGGTLLAQKGSLHGVLDVHDLPMLDASRQYQLWLIHDGRRTDGGVFSVSESGTARLQVLSPHPLDRYHGFGITIEPRGGSPGPTGSKVLGG